MDRQAVAAIAALDDDVRRALFEHVRAAGVPVTREDAARAVGISRKLAAFHLDKLVELGLLRSGFGTKPPGRVGRAPRRYEPAPAEVTVSVPQREPEVLGAILVEAVTCASDGSETARAAGRVAAEHGRLLGADERERRRGGRVGVERAMAQAHALLARHGYEPYQTEGALRLRNCPFHRLAAAAPEFVCGVNLAYLSGMLEGLGVEQRVDAVLAPHAGECCVELRPRG